MGAQEFATVDVVRLEVETDPSGLVNRVQNPSGELGGWGWITPVTQTRMRSGTSPSFRPYLAFDSLIAQASHFYTEPTTIAPGQYAGAFFNVPIAPASCSFRGRFEFLNTAGAVIGTSAQTAYLTTTGDRTIAPVVAPAGSARVRLRFDLYEGATTGAPVNPASAYLKRVTVAVAASVAAFTIVRKNLCTCPSFETNTTGWSGGPFSRTTAGGAASGSYALRTAPGYITTYAGSTGLGMPVTAGETYHALLSAKKDGAQYGKLAIRWFDGAGIQVGLSQLPQIVALNNAFTPLAMSAVAPNGATRAKVEFTTITANSSAYIDALLFGTPGAYFDGSTAAAAGWTYAWDGTAHASTSTATRNAMEYIDPIHYLNVIGESHQAREVRNQLQVGTLTAEILSSTLDPATSDLIRPGRRARLTALVNGVWEQLIGGTMLKAEVVYELRDPKVPDSKRAQITVTIADNAQVLANAQRPEGVATIDELPFVLEGAGVPWSVNNSGGQAPTADVTTYNEAASALTQVALTRDTRLGYAWISRLGVLTAWDAALLPSGSPLVLDESHYSDLDVSFSTEDCINELSVTVQSVALDGSTEETTYGPYIDQPSIDQWGRYKADFTVTGLDGTEVDALAAAVLAANGTPRRRVNSVTLPLTTLARVNRHALIDLYAEVQVNNAELGLSDVLRVTGREATIDTEKWMLTLKFTHDGGVAAPIFQPPVVSGVRPGVGKIDYFGGPVAKIPSNSLLCDGASYAVADYPFLFAIIGYTYGGAGAFFNVPNLVDRFPIGVGTKALGTSGGAPTKVIANTNLPVNLSLTATGTASGGTTENGGLSVVQGLTGTRFSHPVGVGGTGAALDVMNPWLSLTPIIQAI